MLLVGSDDGVYGIDAFGETASPSATQLADVGRTRRLRTIDGVPGVFAAAHSGLYHSPDGDEWTDLGVPEGTVYTVGASLDGRRLYAGTRPAAIYAADLDADDADVAAGDAAGNAGDAAGEFAPDDLAWSECDGFQELPSREEWRLPRHENLAQVRDVVADPGGEDRIVAGVEVGGVHLSEDGGETWADRAEGTHDDVHELDVVAAGTYVTATGYGLYWTHDAGRSWERLDEDVEQRYFRRVFSLDGEIYAGANMRNSTTWNDEDANPGAFRVRADGSLEELAIPDTAGTVTGMTAVAGELVLATHRGHLFVQRDGEIEARGQFPVPGEVGGRYTPVAWLDD